MARQFQAALIVLVSTALVRDLLASELPDSLAAPPPLARAGFSQYSTSEVQLWTSPGFGAALVTSIRPGTEVMVLEDLGFYGGYRVQFDDHIGYLRYFDLPPEKETFSALRDRDEEANRHAAATRSLLIRALYVQEIDHAGGVRVVLRWASLDTTRTIKYLDLTVDPYNAVGDRVYSEIGSKSRMRLSITGPIKGTRRSTNDVWERVWYNSTISCVKVVRVAVEYMDGVKDIYVKDLPTILAPTMSNRCSYNAQ